MEQREVSWGFRHVRCDSRLPHVWAGVLLGKLLDSIQQSRRQQSTTTPAVAAFWATTTDVLSVVLLLTAIQAPVVQHYYGMSARTKVSIGLQAVLLPLHAAWLAGIVLAYHLPEQQQLDVSNGVPICWTRRVLSFKPLASLGDISLVLYCLHIVVLLFYYASVWNKITSGDWHVVKTTIA